MKYIRYLRFFCLMANTLKDANTLKMYFGKYIKKVFYTRGIFHWSNGLAYWTFRSTVLNYFAPNYGEAGEEFIH